MEFDYVAREIGTAIERLVLREGFELPLHAVVLGRNGSVLASRYQRSDSSGLDCEILAAEVLDGVYATPVNIMFVDSTGQRAARVVISGSDGDSRFWLFGDEPTTN